MKKSKQLKKIKCKKIRLLERLILQQKGKTDANNQSIQEKDGKITSPFLEEERYRLEQFIYNKYGQLQDFFEKGFIDIHELEYEVSQKELELQKVTEEISSFDIHSIRAGEYRLKSEEIEMRRNGELSRLQSQKESLDYSILELKKKTSILLCSLKEEKNFVSLVCKTAISRVEQRVQIYLHSYNKVSESPFNITDFIPELHAETCFDNEYHKFEFDRLKKIEEEQLYAI